MGKGMRGVRKKFIVETEMHPKFDASYLRLSLVGMLVTVIDVREVCPIKPKRRGA